MFAPKVVPKRLVPAFATRDFNDMRKVVVVGCKWSVIDPELSPLTLSSPPPLAGPAAIGAIEALRLNGFTGEIVMVTKGTKMPYDKSKLTKSFKHLNYDHLTLRDEDWFRSQGVNFMLGREVIFADKTVTIMSNHLSISFIFIVI